MYHPDLDRWIRLTSDFHGLADAITAYLGDGDFLLAAVRPVVEAGGDAESSQLQILGHLVDAID